MVARSKKLFGGNSKPTIWKQPPLTRSGTVFDKQTSDDNVNSNDSRLINLAVEHTPRYVKNLVSVNDDDGLLGVHDQLSEVGTPDELLSYKKTGVGRPSASTIRCPQYDCSNTRQKRAKILRNIASSSFS